ncbi:radical SAM protein [Myxococcota bacterium]|nr:radical SAM protein [Myxococcota bacterium]
MGAAAPAAAAGALRAPTEVHLAVTSRCPARCSACYLPRGGAPAEPGGEEIRSALRQLASLGVFEVAFGGGEPVLRDDLLDLAREARDLGLVPNLTTSGIGLTAHAARRMAGLFGQVNVSLDGFGAGYEAVRGWDGTRTALAALERLGEAGVRAGVNTVLTRSNVGNLADMGAALAERGVAEWQWLRLKPAGDGAQVYETMALSADEALTLWPRALSVEAETGLAMRFDCALVPFLAAHGLPPDRLRRLGVEGCAGGHSLWSRGASGGYAPCSFVEAGAGGGAEAAEIWAADPVLGAWRRRAEDPPEPCASCDYREVCRGGCRVVARHRVGDAMAPDPECPRVRAASGAAS